ncbi:MAG: uroporphyrinogen decarboxylase family protein [Thermofilaceae archaeon]
MLARTLKGAFTAAEEPVGAGFEEHNRMVERLWRDFRENKHERVPVLWSMNDRMIVLHAKRNLRGFTYHQVYSDPEAMLQVQLEFERWRRLNVWADWEMGLPREWSVSVCFHNVYESAWLGAPLYFPPNSVPDVRPFLMSESDVRSFIARGTPDPFSGFMARVRRFYEYFLEKKESGFTYLDRPIGQVGAPIGTDGPFTVAYNITGGFVLKLLYRNRRLAEEFLWFLTEAIIERMKAWHRLLKVQFPHEGFGFADDAIQNLSPGVYREVVLPLHREIVRTFCAGRPSIHLCGSVMHLLRVLKEELNIAAIDTGFPIDLGKAREVLGDDVLIRGGVRVVTLEHGPLEKIEEEVRAVLSSGVVKGRRFIFGEANNVTPGTPEQHLNYTYELVRRHGRFEE